MVRLGDTNDWASRKGSQWGKGKRTKRKSRLLRAAWESSTALKRTKTDRFGRSKMGSTGLL